MGESPVPAEGTVTVVITRHPAFPKRLHASRLRAVLAHTALRKIATRFADPTKSTTERAASMFIIRLLDGEEIHANEGDQLTINQETGVLTVSRVDGFDEVTTHYSPSVWASVTHRVKGAVGVRPALVPASR
ncbi:hypothetical protein JMUB5695_01984 [Mycobacterium heckeshornense]|nr:hypothetical protein JMUB5695_01984 [Mycobacterium heckeshornense]